MVRSVRLRLLLAIILVVVVSVGVTAFVASQRTSGEFQRYVERGGSIRYRRFAGVLGRAYELNNGWAGIQRDVEQLSQFSGQRVVVADAEGHIIGDSDKILVGRLVSAHWTPSAAIVTPWGLAGALYIDPVAGPDEAGTAFLSAVNRSLLAGALIAGLAAVAVTLAISGRIVRPIENLTAAAQRMEKGQLDVRVPVDSDDEIGKLAHAFNAMAGSLAEQEQLRRNMVSDVAHELRTPLTNLRGYLQAARDGLLPSDMALVENLFEETMLLTRLVSDLQELAQAEAGHLRLERQPATLSGIVAQAIDMLRPQADAKQVALRTILPSDLPLVYVDPERVGQILRNLLNNAVAHTPSGGEIQVLASPCQAEPSSAAHGQMVAVTVRDTGSGIAAEHLPFIFDRFYRADRSRTRLTGGAGLGLAIVKQLVEAQDGSVAVHSEPGHGSDFTFTLPAVRSA